MPQDRSWLSTTLYPPFNYTTGYTVPRCYDSDFITLGILSILFAITCASSLLVLVAFAKFRIIRVAQNTCTFVLTFWDLLIGIILIPMYIQIITSGNSSKMLDSAAYVANRVLFVSSLITRVFQCFIHFTSLLGLLDFTNALHNIVGLIAFHVIPWIFAIIMFAVSSSGTLDDATNVFVLICIGVTCLGYLAIFCFMQRTKDSVRVNMWGVNNQRGVAITSCFLFVVFTSTLTPTIVYFATSSNTWSSSTDRIFCVVQRMTMLLSPVLNPFIHWKRYPLIWKCCVSVLRCTPQSARKKKQSNVSAVFTIDAQRRESQLEAAVGVVELRT